MTILGDPFPPNLRQESFDKAVYFKVMASGAKEGIDKELDLIHGMQFPYHEAYVGALTMKKAGLAGNPVKKLDLFKEGRGKLEAAIRKDSANAELRFLRLMIQEHAPGFLGYKHDLRKDSTLIVQSYKDLPGVVQNAILEYSRDSKVLNPADF